MININPKSEILNPKVCQEHFGFTMLELVVAAAIIGVILTFVLANFRAAYYSGEINTALAQTIDGLTTIRTKSLGGETLTNGSFPSGGYGLHVNQTSPNEFRLYAAFLPDQTLATGELLNPGVVAFRDIDFIRLCGLDDTVVGVSPCQAPWQDITAPELEIIFSPSIGASAHAGPGASYRFVGGVLEHQRTGQQAYFYVSLPAGLVTGDTL